MEKSTKSAALLIGTFYIFKHRTFPAVFPLPHKRNGLTQMGEAES